MAALEKPLGVGRTWAGAIAHLKTGSKGKSQSLPCAYGMTIVVRRARANPEIFVS